MNDYVEERPADHVAVDLSEGRVDGLWRGVSARLGEARPHPVPWRPWALGGGLLVAAGVVIVALGVGRGTGTKHADVPAWRGASLETGADAMSVRLVDGSELKLERASRVEASDHGPSSVKLVLRRGRLGCDVTHRPGRSFVVMAEGVEVRVVGTRFWVATEQRPRSARVEVRVERGVVEVRRAGAAAVRVEAGQTWSQVMGTDRAAGEAAEGSPPALAEPEARPRPGTASPSLGSGRSDFSAQAPSASGPRALFRQAREQWRRGRIQAAADTYQDLLTEFPRDGRAGLAAFELGRLRLDRLGDPRGAARALERAVELAPGAEFREDAMARLVAAHAASRDAAACVRARDQYLVQFPRGVHHRTVVAACR